MKGSFRLTRHCMTNIPRLAIGCSLALKYQATAGICLRRLAGKRLPSLERRSGGTSRSGTTHDETPQRRVSTQTTAGLAFWPQGAMTRKGTDSSVLQQAIPR